MIMYHIHTHTVTLMYVANALHRQFTCSAFGERSVIAE